MGARPRAWGDGVVRVEGWDRTGRQERPEVYLLLQDVPEREMCLPAVALDTLRLPPFTRCDTLPDIALS